jgi:hypothetical protein
MNNGKRLMKAYSTDFDEINLLLKLFLKLTNIFFYLLIFPL